MSVTTTAFLDRAQPVACIYSIFFKLQAQGQGGGRGRRGGDRIAPHIILHMRQQQQVHARGACGTGAGVGVGPVGP